MEYFRQFHLKQNYSCDSQLNFQFNIKQSQIKQKIAILENCIAFFVHFHVKDLNAFIKCSDIFIRYQSLVKCSLSWHFSISIDVCMTIFFCYFHCTKCSIADNSSHIPTIERCLIKMKIKDSIKCDDNKQEKKWRKSLNAHMRNQLNSISMNCWKFLILFSSLEANWIKLQIVHHHQCQWYSVIIIIIIGFGVKALGYL